MTELRTAVAGVEVDWLRVDRGRGPALMASSGDHRVAVSSGGLDFSTFVHTQIPADRVGFQLVTHAPAGMRWCGAETADMDLFMHGPTSSVMARSPAGIRAVSMIVFLDALDEVAHDLGLGALRFPTRVEALARTPEVVALDHDLLAIAATPELLEAPSGTTRLLEAVGRVIAEASSLGLTQLGRVAGRYRSVFGETPRDTLLRAHRNSVPGTELLESAPAGEPV